MGRRIVRSSWVVGSRWFESGAPCAVARHGVFASHEPQAAHHLPLFPDSLDESGWPGRDPGSMPHEPLRLCRRRPARHYPLRAVAFTTHYEQRTTNLRGGHTGPPLRRDKTHHESRAATTGFKPQATYRCFVIPAKRAFGSAGRNPDRRAVYVARRRRKKRWWRRKAPITTSETVLDPSFRWGDDIGWWQRDSVNSVFIHRIRTCHGALAALFTCTPPGGVLL